MRAYAGGLFLAVVCSVPLLGQERDRAIERIDLRLQQPPSRLRGIDPVESTVPTTFGILTLVPPTGPGEMIRVAIPIGELVSRAFKGAAAANRRRQEAAARRKVEAALEWFKEQQPAPKRRSMGVDRDRQIGVTQAVDGDRQHNPRRVD